MNGHCEGDIKRINSLIEITEKINHFKDIDAILDRILLAARNFTRADAGSIFLKQDDNLVFSYVQNDTLASRDATNNKYIYSKVSMPISEKSIAGHVALHAKAIVIDDAYILNPELPYSFNRSFDENSGYRTKAILTVPLTISTGELIGVLQLINPVGEDNEVMAFNAEDERFISFFGNNASIAIERARMTREIILRMIKMAELRDPRETGAHVNRVGSYSIEIYERWARKHNVPEAEIKKFKDVLRIAAMLHDVGKVAISDLILKKAGRLNDEEYQIMKEHTSQGASLFSTTTSDLDSLSADIALNHHEKWDGSGYPNGIKGEQIPLAARITALADVYDALSSPRVYKSAWEEKEVSAYVLDESGKHFDPEVVEAFLEIDDIIQAIKNKYSEI